MAYQAMARRYRPATFDEVIGQEHVARTLKNAIEADRVAHAYLFCGPHGVGKTSMARIFAKALNCTGGPSAELPPDCPICADIAAGRDPDVQEIDGASNNSVDQVRTLREQAGYVPARARFKIYIIDEVHMLSGSAFNALLKTLEEPPAHVKFILATTEPHKLLETVLSRCQRFDFRLVPPPEIAAYLKTLCAAESVAADDDALEAIAAFAAGSMRDGLVLLDQLVSYCPDRITRAEVERVRGAAGIESVIAVYDAVAARDPKAAFAVVDEVARRGASVGDFLDQLIEYGRDLMLHLVTKSTDNLNTYGPAREAVVRHAESFSLERALLALDIFTSARVRVRTRALSNPLVPLEMAVARLAGMEGIESVGSVIARIEELADSGALSGGLEIPNLGQAACASGPLKADGASASRPEKKTVENPASPSVTTDASRKESPPASSPPPAAGKGDSAGAGSAPSAPPPSQAETPPASPPPVSAASSQEKEARACAPEVLTPEAVRERWDEILDAIRKGNARDMAYFHDIRPGAVEEGTVVLELPAGGVFLMEQIEDRDRHARVTEALQRVLGPGVAFRMVLADGSESPADSSGREAAAPRSSALSDPAVQQIMERFKCDVLNIE